jgi:hypothetical protein
MNYRWRYSITRSCESFLTLSRKRFALGQFAAILLLTSCHHGRPDTWPKAHLEIPPVSAEAYREYKMHIDDQKNIIESTCVVIDGEDIQLPLTAGDQTVQENRLYSFYVWGYDPDDAMTPLEILREHGTFSLEVIGAKAEIRVPNYFPAAGPPQKLLNSVTNGWSEDFIRSLQSRNVLEVRIRSQDLHGSFSIVAWFPKKYSSWRQNKEGEYSRKDFILPSSSKILANDPQTKPNPWGDRRLIKVYNGDLRTHVDIVDQQEAEASFGTLFAEHFYVGRVYLRNRHPDKRMVVYTTSLRANVLMYRPPLATNASHSPALGSPKSQRGEPMLPVPYSDAQLPQLPLTREQTNTLVESASNQWAKAQRKLTEKELNTILEQAFETAHSTGMPRDERNKRAQDLARKLITQGDPEFLGDRQKEASARLLMVWSAVDAQVQAWEVEAKREQAEAESLGVAARSTGGRSYGEVQKSIALLAVPGPEKLALLNAAEGRYQASLLVGALGSAKTDEVWASYWTATNTLQAATGFASGEKEQLLALAKDIFRHHLVVYQNRKLAVALRQNSPQALSVAAMGMPSDLPDLVHQYQEAKDAIRTAATAGHYEPLNPFDRVEDVSVNPESRALAFSRSSERQLQLSQVGYLWRETYRPMTFQAVLNALMYTHDNSWSARTVRVLQSLATFAGGMVGLGTAIHEFSSQGYLQGVNLFSTIFVPEVGKLILDDLT